MIIHGRQQILPPNVIIGRTQIQGACIGRERIIGLWLGWQAVQAIIAAFGVDGTAVIRATNEYLNGIAASDKAKATALAGFINEDPMLVCSLELKPQGVTMPYRYLVGDGEHAISTGLYGETNDTFEANIKFLDTNNGATFGSRTSATSNSILCAFAANLGLFLDFGDYTETRLTLSSYTVGGDYYIFNSKSSRSIGSLRTTTSYTGSVATPEPIHLLAAYYRGNGLLGFSKNAFRDYTHTKGTSVHRFIPCRSNSNFGFLDMYDLSFHYTQGAAFTELYTRNGQPWTPPTP